MPICTWYTLVDLTPKYPTLVATSPRCHRRERRDFHIGTHTSEKLRDQTSPVESRHGHGWLKCPRVQSLFELTNSKPTKLAL